MQPEQVQALVNVLVGDIFNLEAQRYACEMKIEDAAESTGNTDADKHLAVQKAVAENTIAMLDRQLTVRRKRLADLQAQLPKQNAAALAPVQTAAEPQTPEPVERKEIIPSDSPPVAHLLRA
jgi:hypothetical protein